MATPTKCKTCDGQGRVVKIRATTLYQCGYVKEMATCPDCRGCRILAPKPVSRFRRLLEMVGAR